MHPLLLLFGCVGAAFSRPAEVVVLPRETAWEEFVGVGTAGTPGFDERYVLPFGPTKTRCLRSELADIVRFELSEAEVSGGGEPRCLGDALALFSPLRDDPAARNAELLRLAAQSPELWERIGTALTALVRIEDRSDDDWNPEKKSSADGFLLGPTWDLDGEAGTVWPALGGRHEVTQAATLIWNDFAAIKDAENDYAELFSARREDYEELRVRPGSHCVGRDSEGAPCVGLALHFRRDLPFPFGSYRCRLRILARPGPEGTLVTDVYSKSRDFHWLAGRDVLYPVHTSDKRFVATLVLRVYGFDLRRVPDKPKHARAALRASLADLAERAEARPRGSDLLDGAAPFGWRVTSPE